MSWTVADFTTQETADILLDKPLLIAVQNAENTSTISWGSVTAGAQADNAEAATGFSVGRMRDRFGHLRSKRNTAAASHSVAMTWANSVTFDCVFIWNHNLGETCSNIQMQVWNGAVWTDIVSQRTATSGRMAILDIDHANPVTGAVPKRYTTSHLRIQMIGSTTFTPEIGEIWVGRRRQLHKRPRIGYNEDGLGSLVTKAESFAGIRRNYVKHRGRAMLNAKFLTTTDAESSTILSWFDDTEQGTKPFVWIEKPNSAPNDGKVMNIVAPQLSFPDRGNNIRSIVFDMMEQAPFKKLD